MDQIGLYETLGWAWADLQDFEERIESCQRRLHAFLIGCVCTVAWWERWRVCKDGREILSQDILVKKHLIDVSRFVFYSSIIKYTNLFSSHFTDWPAENNITQETLS